MAYIPLKTVIERTVHSALEMKAIARDKTEIQLQFKDNYCKEEFFNLDRQQATLLMGLLNEFLFQDEYVGICESCGKPIYENQEYVSDNDDALWFHKECASK